MLKISFFLFDNIKIIIFCQQKFKNLVYINFNFNLILFSFHLIITITIVIHQYAHNSSATIHTFIQYITIIITDRLNNTENKFFFI